MICRDRRLFTKNGAFIYMTIYMKIEGVQGGVSANQPVLCVWVMTCKKRQ